MTSEGWKRALPTPDRPVPQVAWTVAEGGAWHTAQSATTIAVPVGAPPAHSTASCFISPEAGLRAGWVAVGPTMPTGSADVWQSAQAVGWALLRPASEAWNTPG